jgi:plasmid stabilization system protein ParE
VDFPEAARLRPEYGAGVRVVPFGCFLILYRWQAERRTVVVSRIVGAAQRPGPVA